MQTKGQFLLFSTGELGAWLAKTQFTRKVSHIQNHHTWSPRYTDFTGKNHFALLERMKKYHVESNGWSDIGQHLTIFPDGTVAVCRPFENTPACIYGANAGGVCIESVGNFDQGGDAMTAAQRDAIVQVNALLARRFKVPVTTAGIVYHHWFNVNTGERNDGAGHNKTCPGETFFGGNSVAACKTGFLPLVQQALDGAAVPAKPTTGTARVKVGGDTLTIRIAPDGKAASAGALPDGMTVQVYEARGSWRRIDPSRDYWVSGKFLEMVNG